jgi:hypothetical protein
MLELLDYGSLCCNLLTFSLTFFKCVEHLNLS